MEYNQKDWAGAEASLRRALDYEVPVRQAGASRTASFRFHPTMDTLACIDSESWLLFKKLDDRLHHSLPASPDQR